MRISLAKNNGRKLIFASIVTFGILCGFLTGQPWILLAVLSVALGVAVHHNAAIEKSSHYIVPPSDAVSPANPMEFAHDGIVVLSGDGRITYANPVFCRLLQLSQGQIAGKPLFGEIISQGCANGICSVEGAMELRFEPQSAQQSPLRGPMTLRMADHSTLRLSISQLPDGGWMMICSNITDLTHDAERLEELAHVDSMTGLINRRRFFDLAEREWTMAQRYGRDLSVLMLDLDHFKQVNDTFGHDGGDDAIRHVANICQESKRATDIVARLGGEEFALLLPETDLAGAVVLAERIRKRVAANAVKLDIGSVALTISIGVAEKNIDTEHFNALLKLSDQRLYSAKRAGRNRVLAYEPPARPAGEIVAA